MLCCVVKGEKVEGEDGMVRVRERRKWSGDGDGDVRGAMS